MLFASCFRAMQDARSDLEEAMEVAAHVTGVAQVTGKLGPTQMMLCKPDLSDKHMRWFLIDADACTIEWAKKVRPRSSGPHILPLYPSQHHHQCNARLQPRRLRRASRWKLETPFSP